MPRYFSDKELSPLGQCILNGIVRTNQIQFAENATIPRATVERIDTRNLILTMYGFDELVEGLLARDERTGKPINPEFGVLEKCARDYGMEKFLNSKTSEAIVSASILPYYYTQKTREAPRIR